MLSPRLRQSLVLFLLTTLSDTTTLPHIETRIPSSHRIESDERSSVLQPNTGVAYSSVIRPTIYRTQHVVEVKFNGVPRYLLLDTGSADTWMTAPDYRCLNADGKPIAQLGCHFGDPYTGTHIQQIKNESYYQVYGTGEALSGIFGLANVSLGGFDVEHAKVAIVEGGYLIGDNVRSGVLGLAPGAVGALYANSNSGTTPPNGATATYKTVFESMYQSSGKDHERIKPLFSLALQRGAECGYLAFGGLPPISFTPDFVFSPFRGINYYGRHDPTRYYPVQPQSYSINGKVMNTSYRAIVDSGTAVNRLPTKIANIINDAYDPPAVYSEATQLYTTTCNATAPSLSLGFGGRTFAIDPADMLLQVPYQGLCATTITRGFEFGSEAYPEGFYVLGDAFLNNVVAVFDVGAGGMWFSEHEY